MTKAIVGVLMVLAGLVVGFYVGAYLCLFQGIVIVIDQIRAPIMDTGLLAWGIVRVLCCSIAGGLSATVLILPGVTIAKS